MQNDVKEFFIIAILATAIMLFISKCTVREDCFKMCKDAKAAMGDCIKACM